MKSVNEIRIFIKKQQAAAEHELKIDINHSTYDIIRLEYKRLACEEILKFMEQGDSRMNKYDGLLDYVKCNGDSAAQASRANSDIAFNARYPKSRDRQNFLDGRSSSFAEILDYDSNFISKRLGETQ